MGLVVFRADSSSTIGSGHVMRCLALADELLTAGFRSHFVCRAHDGHLAELVQQRGHSISLLPHDQNAAAGSGGQAYSRWLGCNWEADALQTSDVLDTLAADVDWLVVDHYGIDARWERRLAGRVGQILAIDDLADRQHECQLLLDQNFAVDVGPRYEGKVPAGTRLLLGPDYALLHAAYAEVHGRLKPRSGRVRRVAIFFGAAAPVDLQVMAIKAAASMLPGTKIEYVGHAIPAGQSGVVRARAQLAELATLFAEADLVIGGNGVSAWERCCMGAPAVVVAVAENQVESARNLAALGLIRFLGSYPTVTRIELERALTELAGSEAERTAMSRGGLNLVDGHGAFRAAASMIGASGLAISSRRAQSDDEKLLLDWANDADVRANSFTSASITKEAHGRWFASRLKNADDCLILIFESGRSVPLGQVRFEKSALGEWVVDYSVDRRLRGIGLGKKIIKDALRTLEAVDPAARVVARVKVTNLASAGIFRRLGFEESQVDGSLVFSTNCGGRS